MNYHYTCSLCPKKTFPLIVAALHALMALVVSFFIQLRTVCYSLGLGPSLKVMRPCKYNSFARGMAI